MTKYYTELIYYYPFVINEVYLSFITGYITGGNMNISTSTNTLLDE